MGFQEQHVHDGVFGRNIGREGCFGETRAGWHGFLLFCFFLRIEGGKEPIACRDMFERGRNRGSGRGHHWNCKRANLPGPILTPTVAIIQRHHLLPACAVVVVSWDRHGDICKEADGDGAGAMVIAVPNGQGPSSRDSSAIPIELGQNSWLY